jgi:hypothetical protein
MARRVGKLRSRPAGDVSRRDVAGGIYLHEPDLDMFGLRRESRIAASGVRNVFTPHQPISQVNLLFGRSEEVGRLVQTLNTPGQHVLLYGERGVGKSSLANVVSEVILQAVQPSFFVKRCDQSDIFESILRRPLEAVGASLTLTEVSDTSSSAEKGGVNAGVVNVGGERKADFTRKYGAYDKISPSTAAEALRDLDGLLLVDEFDAIKDSTEKLKMAELIKQLSDSGSPFKIMVVGIAETGDELTSAHPSVQRCLRETKLNRMKDSELRPIVTIGAAAIHLTFSESAVDAIVRLSAGYPHFTHLLALKCAEDAIGASRQKIEKVHLEEAMKHSVTDAEGTLTRIYEESTRAPSPMYAHILAAAASLETDEFTSSDLRIAIEARTGEVVSQGSLNNYFTLLMSSEGNKILRRVTKGVYRFEDPRMRSYVRIVHQMV